jgi:hypothetical protein
VLDPVMIASSEQRILDQDAESAVTRLLNQVDLVTLPTSLNSAHFCESPPRPAGKCSGSGASPIRDSRCDFPGKGWSPAMPRIPGRACRCCASAQ